MMSQAKRNELRQKYAETWGRDWPHDNAHLHTLWLEAKEAHSQGPKSKQRSREATKSCLEAMRLDHPFDVEGLDNA